MKINDKVKVIAGSDFGRIGTVFKVFEDEVNSVAVTYDEERTDIGVYPEKYLEVIEDGVL
jgi:ribosomal protein L24